MAQGLNFSASHCGTDGVVRTYDLRFTAETPAPVVSVDFSTVFDVESSLADLVIHEGSATPELEFEAVGFARLTPSVAGRVHSDWTKKRADGLYRCLMRWNGQELDYSFSRRVGISGRIRREGTNWLGLRLEVYRKSDGQGQLHLREYTGDGGKTNQLATVDSDWSFNNWHWLELDLAGAQIRARLYGETQRPPSWQILANTNQLVEGAFGPHAFPALGQSPAIDVRRIEYKAPYAGNP